MNQVVLPPARRTIFASSSSSTGTDLGLWLILPASAAVAVLALLALTDQYYEPLIAIAGVAGLIGLVRAVRYTTDHPEWLVCFLALLGILIDSFFLGKNLRASLHYGLLLLFCLPILPRLIKSSILWKGGFRLYLFYFAWAAITVIYSAAPLDSLLRLTASILSFCALGACILEVTSAEDITRVLSRYLTGCVIALALALAGSIVLRGAAWQTPLDSFTAEYVSQLQARGITISGLDRFRAIFTNPNSIGELTLVTVSAALVLWGDATKNRRFLLALVIAAALGSDIIADSRTPLVALSIGAAAYVLWKYRARGVLAFAAILALAVAVLIFSGINLREYAMRGEGNLTGRTDMWRFVIQQIKEHPILGYGYETAGSVLRSPYSPLWDRMWNEGVHTSLHDGYLDHMVGVGVPATIFWLYIMLRPWAFVFRQPGDPGHLKSIALLIVLPLLIHNFTEASIGDCEGAIGALFGLAWFVAERYRITALARAKIARAEHLRREPAGVKAILYCQDA
jgi:O-antigen ligase